MQKYDRSGTSGVSESIGFLLIFAIVIAGIGLVTLYGYPMLLKQQVNADEQIMEKNMIVLQNDMKGLAYKTVPYKETSLKIGSGSLAVYNSAEPSTSSTLTITDSANNMYVDTFRPGELRYESDSAYTDISLQDGAVVLRQHFQPGSVMLAKPRWFYDSQTRTMVINLINITSTEFMSKQGIGTVQMKMGGTQYNEYTIPGGTTVHVAYNPNPDPEQDYSTAWKNYFLGLDPTVTTDATGFQLPPISTLVIKKTEIIIQSV